MEDEQPAFRARGLRYAEQVAGLIHVSCVPLCQTTRRGSQDKCGSTQARLVVTTSLLGQESDHREFDTQID